MPTRQKADGRLWMALEATERHEIRAALAHSSGNVTMAAIYLEVSKGWLYRACMRLEISPTQYR